MYAPLPLLGLDEPDEKSVPETRLKNGNDARQLLWGMIDEDEQASFARAKTKGMVDGNPPYNDAKRRAEGRSWECNLNFNEGESIMDASAVPYYNLFAQVPYYADVRTMYKPDDPNHEMWNESICYRFHNLLKRWEFFDWNIQQASYWMRLHGIGPCYFDKEGDWRFRALETGSVLVPKGSPSSLDNRIPYIAIRIPYRIMELYDKIRDPEAAAAAGRNVKATRNAIKFGMKGLVGGNDWWSTSWETYERMIKNNELTVSFTDGDIVNCAILLVKEFSGKISKFEFTEHEVVSDKERENDPDAEDRQFLYTDIDCYDSYQQALVCFFQNSGDGTWHSVRGLAQKSFKHVEVSNRLKCQAVNRAFIDSSVVLSTTTGRGRERLELAVWGSVVRLPTGAELKPTTVQGGTDAVMLVDRMLTNHLANNIGQFQQRTLSREDGRGEQPTATQVNQQVSKEASLSQGQITLFYQHGDALYWQIFQRSADPSTSDEEALRFQKECKDDGVPKEALAKMEYVRMNRASGYGSPQMGLMKMQQALPLVPMFPEDGKQAWLEHAVTQLYGPEHTKDFVPRMHIPGDQDWQANIENGNIAEGKIPVISSGQDDVIHVHSHLDDARKTLVPIANQMQSGQTDPATLQDAIRYTETMAQHVQDHLARMRNDPTRKKQVKLFEDEFKQLVGFNGQLYVAFRDAQRKQQLEAEQSAAASSLKALDQAKVESVRTGTALAAAKTQSQIENQRAKTLQQMRLKAAKAGHDMSLERADTFHSMNLENIDAAHQRNLEAAPGNGSTPPPPLETPPEALG
jgi:hypothetical protein